MTLWFCLCVGMLRVWSSTCWWPTSPRDTDAWRQAPTTSRTTDGLKHLIGSSFPRRSFQHLSCHKLGKYHIRGPKDFNRENNSNILFRRPGDTSNFTDYPDSDSISAEVPRKEDPFLNWWGGCSTGSSRVSLYLSKLGPGLTQSLVRWGRRSTSEK